MHRTHLILTKPNEVERFSKSIFQTREPRHGEARKLPKVTVLRIGRAWTQTLATGSGFHAAPLAHCNYNSLQKPEGTMS